MKLWYWTQVRKPDGWECLASCRGCLWSMHTTSHPRPDELSADWHKAWEGHTCPGEQEK